MRGLWGWQRLFLRKVAKVQEQVVAIHWISAFPKVRILKSNPQWDNIWRGAFVRWLGHESGALVNSISAFIKEAKRTPFPFCYVRIPQEDDYLWTRKLVLTRHWTCQGLDLGLPCFLNCEKWISVVEVPPSPWCTVIVIWTVSDRVHCWHCTSWNLPMADTFMRSSDVPPRRDLLLSYEKFH